jgi:hypothetical protein
VSGGRHLPGTFSYNGPPIAESNAAYLAAEDGSDNLLSACLNLYAVKAMRERTSLEEAMLSTLYAPAQVQAWRAAA